MCESCVFYAYECISEVYESLARGWGAHTTTELCVPPYGETAGTTWGIRPDCSPKKPPISYSSLISHTHKRTLLYVKGQTSILRVEESRTGWRSVARHTHTRAHTHTRIRTRAHTHTHHHTLSPHTLDIHPSLSLWHTQQSYSPLASPYDPFTAVSSLPSHTSSSSQHTHPLFIDYHPILHHMASYSFLKNTSHFLVQLHCHSSTMYTTFHVWGQFFIILLLFILIIFWRLILLFIKDALNYLKDSKDIYSGAKYFYFK